jgi:hypothetical protein
MYFFALELDFTVLKRKQRKIPAHPNVKARPKLRPALTDDYRPCPCQLAAKQLNTAILGVTVPAITR